MPKRTFGSNGGPATAASSGGRPKMARARAGARFGPALNPLAGGVLRIAGSGATAKAFAKLRFVQTHKALNISGGTPGTVAYRLNSLFDPDFALGGNQPYRFDQIVGLGYQQYMVHAVKVLIIPEIRAQSGVDASLVITTEINQGGATPAASAANGIERCFKYRYLNFSACTKSDDISWLPMPQKNIKFFRKLKNLIGSQKLETSVDGSGVGTNPSRVLNLNVWGWDTSNSISATIVFTIVITYYAQFYAMGEVVGS